MRRESCSRGDFPETKLLMHLKYIMKPALSKFSHAQAESKVMNDAELGTSGKKGSQNDDSPTLFVLCVTYFGVHLPVSVEHTERRMEKEDDPLCGRRRFRKP